MSSIVNTSDVGGTIEFGNRNKAVLWIPALVAVVIVLVVGQVTGMFKKGRR